MADVQRFQEAISSYVLDAGESISYRSLASQVGGESASRAQALVQFYQQNGDGVGAMHVAVEQNISGAKKMDPRARVVRLSTSSEKSVHVYGVYPSSLQGTGKDADAMEAMALALWAQERKVRNDLFTKTSRHAPLTRELRAFYESDVHCAAATSRSDVGGSQGEEAVTMFDSIKSSAHTSSGRNTQMQGASSSSSSASSIPSLFKNSSSAAPSSSSTSTAKSTSFFKSSSTATATSAKSKPTSSTAVKSKTPVSQPDTKRIDSNAMSNVFTIDSDDDDDGSDDDNAPKFVKASSTQKPRSKRVVISDDEEEDDKDDGFEQVSPPPQKDTARASTKRKLSASPERPAKQMKQSKPAEKKSKAESPKRKRVAEKEDEEEEETMEAAAEKEADDQPQAEDDTLPTGPIKRRVAVTKTTINELGYMVTEKVFEDVEVSAEDLAKERAEAKKKQAAAQAAQKARAAAAASKAAKTDKASTGPAKQKKLDFFFTRK